MLPAVEALAMEKKLSADLNTATSIAHGVGYMVVIKKVESYMVNLYRHENCNPLRRSLRPRHCNLLLRWGVI